MFVKFSSARVIDHKSVHKMRTAKSGSSKHCGSFDYEPNTDGKYLYVAVRACTADVPNLNWDMLPHEELKTAYKSFVGSSVFLNHDNTDPEKARGAIIDAAYHDEDPEDRWVEILMEMDEDRCPKLCSLIRSGEIDTVSMGCSISHSECSVCGNVAEYPYEFCTHIQQKGHNFNGTEAYEICHGIDFFECSWVYDPADVSAQTMEIAASKKKAAGKTAAKDLSLAECVGERTASYSYEIDGWVPYSSSWFDGLQGYGEPEEGGYFEDVNFEVKLYLNGSHVYSVIYEQGAPLNSSKEEDAARIEVADALGMACAEVADSWEMWIGEYASDPEGYGFSQGDTASKALYEMLDFGVYTSSLDLVIVDGTNEFIKKGKKVAMNPDIPMYPEWAKHPNVANCFVSAIDNDNFFTVFKDGNTGLWSAKVTNLVTGHEDKIESYLPSKDDAIEECVKYFEKTAQAQPRVASRKTAQAWPLESQGWVWQVADFVTGDYGYVKNYGNNNIGMVIADDDEIVWGAWVEGPDYDWSDIFDTPEEAKAGADEFVYSPLTANKTAQEAGWYLNTNYGYGDQGIWSVDYSDGWSGSAWEWVQYSDGSSSYTWSLYDELGRESGSAKDPMELWSLEDAMKACDAAHEQWKTHPDYHSAADAYTTAPRAPEEVSTIEDDLSCPLCGSENFDGEYCDVCGYQEPPEGFGDIEIEHDEEIEEELDGEKEQKEAAVDYDVVTEINPAWSDYDRTQAEIHLMNYGEIYVDEYGQPIDNEFDLGDIASERGKIAHIKTLADVIKSAAQERMYDISSNPDKFINICDVYNCEIIGFDTVATSDIQLQEKLEAEGAVEL